MIKKILGLFIFGLLVNAALAQTTTVTATLTDSDSTLWAGCAYTGNLISPNGTPYINGVQVTAMSVSGTCNGSGVLTAVVATTSSITPVGAYWSFSVKSNTSAPAVSGITLTTTGASQNSSAVMSAQLVAPRFPAGAAQNGYADVEVTGVSGGALYYNWTLATMRLYTSAWTSLGTSSGGVTAINGTTGGFTFTGSVSCVSTTCTFSGGGLASFTTGNLSPLFTASLGGSPTTGPALAFTPSTAAQNFVLAGPATGGTGAYSFRALVAADLPATTFAWSCQPTAPGDGVNAITAATYPLKICRNDTGKTITITGIACYSDTGSSTMNVANNAGSSLLAAAITCSSSYATGSQSATTTLVSGDALNFTFVADGTTTRASFDVTGTHQ